MRSPQPNSARRLIAIVAVGAASALGIGALAQPAGAVTKPTKAVRKATPRTTFPKLKVLDLATAKTIDLASFNVSAKPQLIWFWAPT